MIRLTGAARAINRLAGLNRALTPEALDSIVDRVALQTMAELVKATPKRWFGQVRRAWHILKPEEGVRIIRNGSKIMVFLEHGTANGGTGFITPKVKKFLYIPLTRRAAGGWHEGLVYGRDYVLAKRARGIKPRNIVSTEKPKAEARLAEAIKGHVRKAVNG
jgi:hypothetical protein